MTIPFLDLFKKLTGRFGRAPVEELAAPTAPVRAPKKSASERLSKTVLPHATRSFSAPDPFRSAAGVTPGRSTNAPTMQLGSERITSASKKTQTGHLPPALARALEPKLERAISLRIADFLDRIPPGYIKPVEILDAAARVSLKASEIEKGMPEKNPTISLPSLYQQVPEIFIKGVRPDDDTRVALPYDKVLEQFQNAQIRPDQQRDAAVPQLDTPILKATIQDSERFGTKIEPIEASPVPPVPVNPATALTIAAAEPDAIVAHKATPKITLHPAVSLHSPSLKSKSEPSTPPAPPAKIPFQLSPNGTGASASERVPASSGPPVPTPLPFTPELEKVAFKPITEKPAETVEQPKPLPTIKFADAPVTKAEEKSAAPTLKLSETPTPKPDAAKDEPTIRLSLKAVLKNLPAFQVSGDVDTVADDAQIQLPLSLIEPQLATGRISIAPDVFQNALPEKHREIFPSDDARMPAVLPLEEVLKNLPATVLKLRDDQEHIAVDRDFETPFSIKAKEDADRFGADKKSETPESKNDQAPPKTVPTSVPAETNVDPKEIITRAKTFAGVKACAIMFSDGLSLAGELPTEIGAEGLCAMAPVILDRITQHVHQTKLGSLVAVTFYTTGSAVTFFAQGNICLAVLHGADSLPAETRKELAGLSEKLSKHYAKTE